MTSWCYFSASMKFTSTTSLLSILLCSVLAVSSILAQENVWEEEVIVERPHEVRNSHLVCHLAENLNYDGPDEEPKAHFIANLKQKKYTMKGCQIHMKYVELCVPSTKKVYDFGGTKFPGVLKKVSPVPIKNDLLCYSVTCRGRSQAPRFQPVADQFGVKRLRFLRERFRVCVPAWKLVKPVTGSSLVPLEIYD